MGLFVVDHSSKMYIFLKGVTLPSSPLSVTSSSSCRTETICKNFARSEEFMLKEQRSWSELTRSNTRCKECAVIVVEKIGILCCVSVLPKLRFVSRQRQLKNRGYEARNCGLLSTDCKNM